MNKICETCQKTFWAKENKRRFCSRQCQAVWNGNRQRELWPHKDELPKTYYDAAAELVKARHALQAERERVRVLEEVLSALVQYPPTHYDSDVARDELPRCTCCGGQDKRHYPDCAWRLAVEALEAQEPGGVDNGPADV